MSVLFVDLVGYTSLSSDLSARASMAMLHQLFVAWDELVQEYPTLYKLDQVRAAEGYGSKSSCCSADGSGQELVLVLPPDLVGTCCDSLLASYFVRFRSETRILSAVH